MHRSWFVDKNFTSLVIRQYVSISDDRVIKSVTITDAGYVGQFAARIERIPPNGNMMKSFSEDAERVRLFFFSGDIVQEIDVIRKRFKTPSTGFNAINDYEKELYAEIEGLLFQLN